MTITMKADLKKGILEAFESVIPISCVIRNEINGSPVTIKRG